MLDWLKGGLLAVGIELIALYIVSMIYGSGNGVFAFLERTVANGDLVLFGAVATIPNILLFFWFVNRNKLELAKGIQTIIIVIVLFLAVLKFL